MSSVYLPKFFTRWNEDSLVILSDNFTWTGKDDYQQWVIHWKALLQAEIYNIAAVKAILKDKDTSPISRAAAQSEKTRLTIRCFNLYFLRHHSKKQAGKQMPTKQKQEHKEYVVTH